MQWWKPDAESLKRTLSGRVEIDPIPIESRRSFARYLEENATRIDRGWKLPLFLGKEGYFFFEHGRNIMIRYNPPPPNFGSSVRIFFNVLTFRYILSQEVLIELRTSYPSLCSFSGAIESQKGQSVLTGSYRFPLLMEASRGIIFILAVYLILSFIYFAIVDSISIPDAVIFPFVLVFFYFLMAIWFNVSSPLSVFAHNAMKNIDALLDRYVTRR